MNVKLIGAALLACVSVAPTLASAQVSIGISVNIAPPPLPVYVQPPLPGPDFIWTPGYWAWDDYAYAYFWVPGTWVRAPRPGLLWTPPWWGWVGGAYAFHTGYWGPTVGFYGGVPYGFGYTGVGFQGGYWSGGHVSYNSAVTNVTHVTNVTNIYHTTVIENHVTHVSYNGGPGGVQARPTQQEMVAAHQPHLAPTANQATHFAAARSDPRLFASANRGRPPVLATPRALSPMRPTGAAPFAGPMPDGRGGRPGAGPAAMTNDRAVQPPGTPRPQPYRDPQMSGDRGQPHNQGRPGQPPFEAAPMTSQRPQSMGREAFVPGGGSRQPMQPPHGGQPHNPPPPHREPPRPPQQPRPHPQPQPHPQNHPQGQKHEEHH